MTRRPATVCGLAALIGIALTGSMTGCSTAHAATRPADAAWHAAHDTAYGAAGAPGSSSSASPTTHRPTSPGGGGSTPTPPTTPSTSPSPSASGSPAPPPGVQGKGLQLAVDKTADGSVALTFDDGPSEYTTQILAILKQNNVKATFCLIGVNVKAYPDLVRQIVADGHTLCNHSWKHDEHLGDKSADAIRQDLQMTNDEIHKAAPDAPIKYFRHPAGNFTPTAVQVAESLGMTPLGWNADPKDWDLKANKPGSTFTTKIAHYVRTHTHAGTIMLSHDSGGDRSSTIAAYKQVIPLLKQKYTLKALPTS